MQNEFEVIDLLKTKLVRADQDCESETRAAVAELHSSVKYEGGRLRVPDFNKAANLMAAVICCKEKRFSSEISRILTTTGGFRNPEELERAKEFVSTYFEEEPYLKRFESFLQSVDRAAARYGLSFDRQAYRTDIASSLFDVEVKNSTRRALASVQAELALHLHEEQPAAQVTLPGVNDIVDMKPNFMGLGINLNALIKRLWRKCRIGKT